MFIPMTLDLSLFELRSGRMLFDSGSLDPAGSLATPMLYHGRITVIGGNGLVDQFLYD